MTTPPGTDTLSMRLYCHGLGDCNLIGVPDGKGGTFWILIDCSIHTSARGGTDRIRAVVEDLLAITCGRLDVIVGTHEHWDHISGFHQARDLFAKFSVGEVWLAWTEDPANPDARRIDTFKGEALTALVGANLRIDGDERLGAQARGIDSMLGFVFGLKGERVREAREDLRALGGDHVRHLKPGTVVPLPATASAIRAYVLGPPLDTRVFGIEDSASDTYRVAPLAVALSNGLALEADDMRIKNDPLAPFDEGAGYLLSAMLAGRCSEYPEGLDFLSRRYAGDAYEPLARPRWANQDWRRIDSDWLGASTDLALQLDSSTNNTSLVLALEIVSSGKVLIFAADAQVGNWRSWAGVTFGAAAGGVAVTGAQLLERAVFYKVGHHGSRNATLSEGGLELMTSEELTAFIPTDEAMAEKVGWSDIPAAALLRRLAQKTTGRVIQSDADWVQLGGAAGVQPGGSLKALTARPANPGRFEGAPYVDLTIG